MAQIVVGTSTMPVPDKIQFARQVVIDMTGNANFTTPAPTLASITAAATALETAYNAAVAARQVAKSLTSIQDQKSAALDLFLSQEANYVENTTGGDQAKIQSSGFGVKVKPTPIGPLSTVTQLAASPNANAGTADLKWHGVRGAKTYTIQRATDPNVDSSWVQADVATKTRATVNSMTSGTKYWFRVAGVGSSGMGPWSDPVPMVAP